MAIDQDIQQRVNAYRNNPQALQQRYAANQQLLDLLALQRLKSEKDDAARKVQMEMQQNPQTIKQQKEQQLLEMTKQDLVKQTSGIMQNKQQQQQKNMQRIAKQGAASPQQMQRVASGLGALAQRQQRAPRRMAAGGIVAFANGGGVTQAEIDAYREQLRRTNPRAAVSTSDEQIRALLERRAAGGNSTWPFGRSAKERMEAMRQRGYSPYRLFASDAAAEQSPQVQPAELEEKDIDTGAPVLAEAEQVPEDSPEEGRYWPSARSRARSPYRFFASDAAAEQVPGETQVDETTVEALPKPQGIMDLFQQQPKLKAPKVDMANAGSGATSLLKSAGITTGIDPEAARTKARDESATFLGRDEKRNKMNEYLEELKALDVRQQDPKKMRDEQISAFLRGTAGRSGFGGTMAAGSAAMAGERAKQEESERERLLSRIGIDRKAMTMDADLAQQALSDGRSAYEQSMAHQRTTAQVMSQMRGQDLQVAIANANREFEANSNNVKNLLNAANIQYTNDLRLTMESADRRATAGKTLGQIQKDKADFIKDYVDNDPAVVQAENIALTSNDPEAVKAVTTARALAEVKALQQLENAGILDTERFFRDIIEGGGGTMPTAPTMPNFNLSKEGSAAYQRYKPQ